MKRRALSLALIFSFLLASPCHSSRAKESWRSIRSRNFLVVGNAGARDLQQVATWLELFHDLFSRLLAKRIYDSSVPTTLIVFDSDVSFKPFKPLYRGRPADVAGYFQPGADMNYITFSSEPGGRSPFSTAFHEYAHLHIRNNVPGTPLWLNEGLAEYYSTSEFSNGEVVIGAPIPFYLRLLRQNGLLPLRTLFAVGHDSPHYNERDKSSVFYAESWALVHYLLLGNNGQRQQQLTRYLNMVDAGVSIENSFQLAFQADFQTIEKELQEYIRRDALPTQLAPSDRQAGSYANQQAEPLTEAEALFYLGDLLLHINRTGDAEAYFGRAIALEPDLVTVQGALGMLRVRQNRLAEAKRHLQRAARSPNYLVHFYYAYVLSQEEAGGNQSAREYTPEKAAAIRAALKKSLDLAPDYADSHVRSQAQAMLAQFTSGEEAAPASDAALSKPDSGQSYVWERPPSTDSSNPVSSNNTAGGERIRGLLTRIVCAGAGTTLFVKVGERMLKLRGASLDRINFSSQVSTVKEISCGVRRPAVPVEVAYRPTHDLRGQFVGEVLTVEFVP